jgi:hypothetical protein
MGEEVLPALREIGKELGLWSPFEANAPVSMAFPESAAPASERTVARVPTPLEVS